MVSRRWILTAGLPGAMLTSAGCLGFGNGEWKPLVVENDDSTAHTIGVRAEGDFRAQETTKEVQARGSARVAEFVPQLDYDHVTTLTVSVDGTQVTQVKRRVDVDIDAFTVEVRGPETVTVRPTAVAVSPAE